MLEKFGRTPSLRKTCGRDERPLDEKSTYHAGRSARKMNAIVIALSGRVLSGNACSCDLSLYSAWARRTTAMPFVVWWALFCVPLIFVIVSWVALFAHWSSEGQRILKSLAILFPTAATLLACGALLYVQLGGKVGFGGGIEVYFVGLLLALTGTVLGFVVTARFRRWFSALALGASMWMSFLFFLMASTD
jgi:hypothetical protein